MTDGIYIIQFIIKFFLYYIPSILRMGDDTG